MVMTRPREPLVMLMPRPQLAKAQSSANVYKELFQ
jgi:hypothetical protein